MRIPVTFIILGIGLALLYLVFKDDDTSGEWKSAVVTITSRIPGSGTVDYYASGNIEGKMMDGYSVPYRRSEIIYSRGQQVKVSYQLIAKGRKFLFKIDDPNLVEVSSRLKPWAGLVKVLSILSFVVAAASIVYNIVKKGSI